MIKTQKILYNVAGWCLLMTGTLNAQVGINTASPDPSSMLEVSSTAKGVLLPRLTTVQRNTISNPANGLLIYETAPINKFSGYNGSQWGQDVFGNLKWTLNGNSNTNPSTDFLGTINNQDFTLRANGQTAVYITKTGQVRLDGTNFSAPRLFVNRSNAGTANPGIVTAIDSGPGAAYPVNIITGNFSAGSSRVLGNYSFAANAGNADSGNSAGGMAYIKVASSGYDEGLVFYTGGHPSIQSDTSKDAMIIGGNGNRNVYIGYPSFVPSTSVPALPKAKLNVAGGDIYISNVGSGVIMKSPNGSCYKVTVSNTGTLGTASVTCP